MLLLTPIGLVALVLIIAPPVSLSQADDQEKARALEARKSRPEPIPLLPGEFRDAMAARGNPADRPALPRTREELQQLRAALKEREAKLLKKRQTTNTIGRDDLVLLSEEITRYNEDLRTYEDTARAFEAQGSK